MLCSEGVGILPLMNRVVRNQLRKKRVRKAEKKVICQVRNQTLSNKSRMTVRKSAFSISTSMPSLALMTPPTATVTDTASAATPELPAQGVGLLLSAELYKAIAHCREPVDVIARDCRARNMCFRCAARKRFPRRAYSRTRLRDSEFAKAHAHPKYQLRPYFLASDAALKIPTMYPDGSYPDFAAQTVPEPVVHENVACTHCKMRSLHVSTARTEVATGQEYRRHPIQMHRVSTLR